mmetsp:Transcript_57477/g.182020  ORF Transcript_57477/g.182020 Transcript_57477/m.182020 type:complete len:272 (-) Transcript_57477:421-1236(-)
MSESFHPVVLSFTRVSRAMAGFWGDCATSCPPSGGLLTSTSASASVTPSLSRTLRVNSYRPPGARFPGAMTSADPRFPAGATRGSSRSRYVVPEANHVMRGGWRGSAMVTIPCITSFWSEFHTSDLSGAMYTSGISPRTTLTVACASATLSPLLTRRVKRYGLPGGGRPTGFSPSMFMAAVSNSTGMPSRSMHSAPARDTSEHVHSNASSPGSPSGSRDSSAERKMPASVPTLRPPPEITATRGDPRTANLASATAHREGSPARQAESTAR